MMIQSRAVKSYFKLRGIAQELAQFYWAQNEKDLGKTQYEKIREEKFFEIVQQIDAKADRLYAADVAHAYYYHIRSKLRKAGARSKRRKRIGASKSRR